VSEAKVLEQLGADAIIAQGSEAGAHRGTFLDASSYEEHSLVSLHSLLHTVKEVVSVPVIAAGGIMDGGDVAAALMSGASAAQLGTAFLTTTEAGTTPMHRRQLLERDQSVSTVVTKCFTGKLARGFVNKWVMEMDSIQKQLPNCFNGMPAGRIMQGVAVQAQRDDLMYLWAGQGHTRCRPEMGAAELTTALIAETDAALGIADRQGVEKVKGMSQPHVFAAL
jgi:nitronate monooxygenase